MKKFVFLATAFAVLSAPVAAADQPYRVRGTIVSLTGSTLNVMTNAGPTVAVVLSEKPRVSYVVKADLATIVPGSYLGVVSAPQPDGTIRAIAINIFPEALRGVGEGSRPYDLAPASTMTNAAVSANAPLKVDNVDARVITLTYKDGEKKVVVPTGTPIVTSAPADTTALVPGGKVSINAVKHDDGTITAASVNVGKDGLTPPN